MTKSPWQILGIKKTNDKRAVKKAYAAKLKVTRPEDDPVAFQHLVEAKDLALLSVKNAMEVSTILSEYSKASKDKPSPIDKKHDSIIVKSAEKPLSAFAARKLEGEIYAGNVAIHEKTDISEKINEFLIRDVPEVTSLESGQLILELRDLTVTERIIVEPEIIAAVQDFYRKNPTISKLHKNQPHRVHLIVNLNKEFNWTEDERGLHQKVWYLDSNFSEDLKRTIDPNYIIKPQVPPRRADPKPKIWQYLLGFVIASIFFSFLFAPLWRSSKQKMSNEEIIRIELILKSYQWEEQTEESKSIIQKALEAQLKKDLVP